MTHCHNYSFSFNEIRLLNYFLVLVLVRNQLIYTMQVTATTSKQSSAALEILSLLAWICSEVHCVLTVLSQK